MDSRLAERLEKIADQLDALREAEHLFLSLEANRKVMWAELFLQTQGTVVERESKTFASDGWKDFMRGHVIAESAFNHERRLYEMLLKAYDAEHLTLKTETPVIRRQG